MIASLKGLDVTQADMVKPLVFAFNDPFVRHMIEKQGKRCVRFKLVAGFQSEAGHVAGAIPAIAELLAANGVLG